MNMVNIILNERPDHVIHLGDHVRDADELADRFPALFITRVVGNCDHITMCSEKLVREFCGFRFFLTHGHHYGVKSGLLRLTYAAMEVQADIVLFGHTHIPMYETRDQLKYLNPGTCSTSRGTYALIEICDGQMFCSIKSIE